MSFSRIKPANWSVGEVYTSVQASAADAYWPFVTDKSVAGDAISGTWTFASGTSALAFSSTSPGVTMTTATNKLDCGAAKIQIKGDGTAAINSGGSLSCASGAAFTVSSGCTTNMVLGAGSVLQQVAGGAVQVLGASNIAITTTTTRTVDVSIQVPLALATGWGTSGVNSANGSALVAPNSGAPQTLSLAGGLHTGATLSTVKIWMIALGPHASLPAILPQFNVFRRSLATGALTTVSLGAGYAAPSPANGPAWDNSGNVQSWTFTCTGNNVIDTTQYAYFITLFDESGASSVAGNTYIGLTLGYTAIGDMRFP